jgi:rhodanese-related sulfurtransferase
MLVTVTEMSVQELKRKHDAGEAFVLLDVREPDEIATASVPFATTIAMGSIPLRYAELPKDKPIVVMCHHGGRSERATAFLNANGYANAVNLTGGIDAWATEIDPSVSRY